MARLMRSTMWTHLRQKGSLFCLAGCSAMATAQTITLPIEFDDFGTALVTLSVAGQPLPFVLDTGSAEGLHLSAESIASLKNHLTQTGSRKSIDLAGKTIENASFMLDKLIIADMTFSKIDVTQYQPWGLTLGDQDKAPDQQVIGLGLFRDNKIIIDYQKSTLEIEKQETTTPTKAPEGWIQLPFVLTKDGLIVNMRYHDKSYPFVLDTGATFSLVKSSVLPADAERISCEEMFEFEGCTLVPMTPESVSSREMLDLVIQDNLPEEFTAAGILGTNFFEQFTVMVDFPNQQLFLKLSQ